VTRNLARCGEFKPIGDFSRNSGCSLGPAPASGYNSAAERLGLCVRQVKLADALPGICEHDPDNGTLPVRYLLA
jgi:hypothetical protein